MLKAYKHAAMALKPSPETLKIPPVKKRSATDIVYKLGRFIVFKTPDIPHSLDVYEIVGVKKIKQIACILRPTDQQALQAVKTFLLTKV